MTRKLCVVVVVIMAALGPTLVVAQSKPATSTVDPSLRKAIDSRRSARIAKDIATWERLTNDNTVEIHSDGRVHTKAEESAEIKASPGLPESQDMDEKIVMHGSTAVVTYQRNGSNGVNRVTTAWVKDASGNWQAILTQQTALKR